MKHIIERIVRFAKEKKGKKKQKAEEPEQETKQVLSGPVSTYVKAISRSLKR